LPQCVGILTDPTISLRPLEKPQVLRSVAVITRNGRTLSPAAEAFVDMLRESVKVPAGCGSAVASTTRAERETDAPSTRFLMRIVRRCGQATPQADASSGISTTVGNYNLAADFCSKISQELPCGPIGIGSAIRRFNAAWKQRRKQRFYIATALEDLARAAVVSC
jgi:hypothetical protein